jgi:uncharacterized protein
LRPVLALPLGLLAAVAVALTVPPPPTQRVNDYASALSAADRGRLEQKLADRERTSSTQIVVGVFRSLEGENLEDYSIHVAQAWRVGQKGLDNGVIFLIFLDDHKMRIEVGYGLEAQLTDATAASIIRDVVAPRFREQRYAEGIEAGLDAIDRAISGTYQRPAARRTPGSDAGVWIILGILGFVFLVITVVVVGTLRAAQRATSVTGSRHGFRRTGTSYGWSDSGSSWSGSSSSSSSSSSDSFSGGGGSFGGGGASGDW